MRREIEGCIAQIANGHELDDDQDTLQETSSVGSSIDDDTSTRTKQQVSPADSLLSSEIVDSLYLTSLSMPQHEMNKIEKVSNDVYKISDSPFADQQITESLLQEKEILQATVQSLKDLLAQIDSSRVTAAVSTFSINTIVSNQ